MALFRKHAPSLLFSLSLLFLGCNKDKDPTKNAQLPAATQTGQNTVGFTLEDGQVWVPYFECGMGQDPCGKYSANVGLPMAAPKGIGLQFARRADRNTQSSLTIASAMQGTVTSVGEKIDSVRFIFQGEDWPANGGTYGFVLPGSRFTVTSFDKAAEVISGEFHLILRNQAGKTVTLSNGRFDFRFNACGCDD